MSWLPIKITKKTFFISFILWNLWTLFYAVILSIGAGLHFTYALIAGIIAYYPLALLSILILIFCRRYPIDRHPILIFALIHFIAALLFSALWLFLVYFINWLLAGELVFQYMPVRSVGIFSYYIGVLIYVLLAGIFYTSETYKRYREKELKASQLQTLSREAELKTLKAQINPHFLFNTLNSIFALIDSNTNKAKTMLTRLSDLLRYSLAAFNKEYVTLENEIDSVKIYLDIEKERFNEKLKINYHIDKDLLKHKIQPMILQPLVENAIKHGISASKEGGYIRVSAIKKNGGVRIHIENSCGKSKQSIKITEEGSGVGLDNLRKRLEKMYDDNFSLNYGYEGSDTFKVIIFIK